jgi:glycosyltransferase involved in cell wall biosynthesis
MRVLYVSYDGMTDPLGQSQVIPYLKGLAARGHQITVLSCEKPRNFARNEKLVGRLLAESGVVWEWLPYRNSPPVVSTLFGIRALRARARRLFALEKFEIVHCRSYLAAFVGLWAKREYGSKFLFDIRGFWPDERLDSGAWDLRNPLYRAVYRYFKHKEVEFFANADYVVSLTYKARKIIQSWTHLPRQPLPVEVIPCCVDLDLFSPAAVSDSKLEEARSKLGLSRDDFVLSYLGSVGGLYLLDEMLHFFARLLLKQPRAKFLFITQAKCEAIAGRAEKYGIAADRLVVTEAARKDVPPLLRLSDVAIFFIKPTYSKSASSPTKQGEIMGLGVPLVCNAGIGDTDLVVERYNAGLLVNDFTESEYDRVVTQLGELPRRGRVKIMRGAREFYSLDRGVLRYDAVYRSLVAPYARSANAAPEYLVG